MNSGGSMERGRRSEQGKASAAWDAAETEAGRAFPADRKAWAFGFKCGGRKRGTEEEKWNGGIWRLRRAGFCPHGGRFDGTTGHRARRKGKNFLPY